MAILEGIEVRVASKATGKALTEYHNPNVVQPTAKNSVEKYIEATTELEYQIEIYIRPEFQRIFFTGLKVELVIDDDTVMQTRFYSPDNVRARKYDVKAFVLSSVKYENGPQWFESFFTFASLKINEKLLMEQAELDKAASVLGRIKVNVTRTRGRRLLYVAPEDGSKLTDSLDTPRELVTCKNITHITSLRGNKVIETGIPEQEPLGIPGTQSGFIPLQFCFKYRDYMKLQLLGCIPESLSIALIQEFTADQYKDLENKNRSLNRRNLDLIKTNSELRAKNQGLMTGKEETEKLNQGLKKDVERLVAQKVRIDGANQQSTTENIEIKQKGLRLAAEIIEVKEKNLRLTAQTARNEQVSQRMAALIQILMGDMTTETAGGQQVMPAMPVALITTTARLENLEASAKPTVTLRRERVDEERDEDAPLLKRRKTVNSTAD